VATPQISLCTLRDLEELGIARDAIQGTPIDQRRRTVRAASGVLSPWLRKRQSLPLTPTIDDEEVVTGGMTGGATVAHDAGPATRARDVAVKFTAAGTTGEAGILCAVNMDFGAFGSSYSAPVALPLDGKLVIDGYAWTIAGAVNVNDLFTYSTRVDPGAATAVAQVAAFLMLGSRGVPAETLETLQKLHDGAIAWAKAVAKGEGDLPLDADATPTRAEAGPRYSGQKTPWQFLGGSSGPRDT
jgi:hypothetical protein